MLSLSIAARTVNGPTESPNRAVSSRSRSLAKHHAATPIRTWHLDAEVANQSRYDAVRLPVNR